MIKLNTKIDYIYFIDLKAPLVCLNFINTNRLQSSSITHLLTYKTIYPLFITNPDKLLTDIKLIEFGFISPRLRYIVLSNWATNGLITGIGINNTQFHSKSNIERIHRIAKLEVEFEKIRRKINTNLPSRLTCIYVAEDNIDGRTMLKNMFFDKKHFLIASVEIHAIQYHRADAKWIDDYQEKGKISAIENYWKGVNFDKNPYYEYLVEGVISLKNEEDRKAIKKTFDKTKSI